jgi:hypothetical protein
MLRDRILASSAGVGHFGGAEAMTSMQTLAFIIMPLVIGVLGWLLSKMPID